MKKNLIILVGLVLLSLGYGAFSKSGRGQPNLRERKEESQKLISRSFDDDAKDIVIRDSNSMGVGNPIFIMPKIIDNSLCERLAFNKVYWSFNEDRSRKVDYIKDIEADIFFGTNSWPNWINWQEAYTWSVGRIKVKKAFYASCIHQEIFGAPGPYLKAIEQGYINKNTSSEEIVEYLRTIFLVKNLSELDGAPKDRKDILPKTLTKEQSDRLNPSNLSREQLVKDIDFSSSFKKIFIIGK
jgi:hypothetical protein